MRDDDPEFVMLKSIIIMGGDLKKVRFLVSRWETTEWDEHPWGVGVIGGGGGCTPIHHMSRATSGEIARSDWLI